MDGEKLERKRERHEKESGGAGRQILVLKRLLNMISNILRLLK